ncbi:hypothetical protein DB217_17285 [Salmonella enterica subsp. enterica serovar Chester]|nr:hypothetical protein [Salmonella enterica subsp. enterica serovar Chester]MLT46672.1 hypothetical protein [Salmonella enterica subsp. enterica serovar Chester]
MTIKCWWIAARLSCGGFIAQGIFRKTSDVIFVPVKGMEFMKCILIGVSFVFCVTDAFATTFVQSPVTLQWGALMNPPGQPVKCSQLIPSTPCKLFFTAYKTPLIFRITNGPEIKNLSRLELIQPTWAWGNYGKRYVLDMGDLSTPDSLLRSGFNQTFEFMKYLFYFKFVACDLS